MWGWVFPRAIIPHKISKYKKHLWLSAIVTVIVAICVRPIWAGFACLSNPCFNGICIDDINRPHDCYCVNGWTGYSCEINWDECRQSPCLNGGTCVDGIASFNCTCPSNYGGALCEYDLSICDEQFFCKNNGTCSAPTSANGTGFSCHCPQGFSGDQCEIDVSICNTTDNICHNGGKCIDGLGSTFDCICPSGWMGPTCLIDIDECDSQPCQNGGICVDKVNDFSCACPFGYMGKACETKLKICEENPCRNGAFCLEEDDKKTCYCVPDYHGVLCEERYNECDPPPKCNGGTCIDGVGGFTCSCPPEFYGPTCECTFANASEPECQGFNTTTAPPLTIESLSISSFPPHSSTASPSPVTLIPETTIKTGIVSPDVTSTPTAYISSGIYDASLSLDSPYDPGGQSTPTISPSFTQSIVLISPGESDILPPLTLSPTISIDHSVSFEPSQFPPLSLPPLLSSTQSVDMESLPASLTTRIYLSDEISTLDAMTIYTDIVHSTPTTGILISATPLPPVTNSSELIFNTVSLSKSPYYTVELSPSILDSSEILHIPTADLTANMWTTTTIIPIEVSPTFAEGESSHIITSKEISLTITQIRFPSSTIIFTPTVSPPMPDASSDYIEWSVSTVKSLSASEQLPEPTSAFTPPISFSPSPLTPIVTFSPDFMMNSSLHSADIPHEASDFMTYSGVMATTSLPLTLVVVTPTPEISITTTIGGSTDPVLSPTPTFDLSTPEPTMLITTTPSSNLSDPCDNYCQNNAKCTSTTIEPHCTCPFRFTGERCEIPRKRFNIPSFSGDSFLTYKLPSETVNLVHIDTQMATVIPEGILLYTGSGTIYSLIFLQSGLVSLHFSCGQQSMHFVEMRTRVDNGYNFTLEFEMNMVIHGVNEFHCIGQVSVNKSYIMKGEQIVGRNGLHGIPIQVVHMGGARIPDAERNDELVSVLPGFRGCMYSLMINQENRDMFEDALSGKDISECSAFGCIVNPCSPSSRCVSTNKFPFWECICSPGFQGVKCQIRVCSSNPCLNGATCTVPSNNNHKHDNVTTSTSEVSTLAPTMASSNTTTTSATPICLCPLDYTGVLCQSRINITKPSFRPISHDDYSAFISYDPIPRFADWVQLKFHFVTTNLSQVSIMMYTGNDWINAAPTNAQLQSPLATDESQELRNSYYIEQDKASDFFAITFLQGFVAVTWNLGSGTQRIITPSRIDNRLNIHTLFAGRSGRQAWLKVDGMRNTTGKAPGPLYRLNVDSDLYVGGFEAFRFEGLPHDLPLHKGFQGCIFDLGFRVKNKLYLPRPIKGRSVQNCYEEDC